MPSLTRLGSFLRGSRAGCAPTTALSGRARGICACLVGLALASTPLTASAVVVPVIIDDFSSPAVPATYIIGLINPDPFLLKQPGGIGGERDLQVDVLGVPSNISAVGTVGGGQYVFGTTDESPSLATLQYDGVDFLDTPGALNNAFGLNVDVTGGGGNNGVRIEFTDVDAGAANTLSVRITATSAGASATYFGAIPEIAGPSNFDVLFSSFTTVGPFNPTAVTSMQFTFNELGATDVDFRLDRILATQVPEPSTVALLACGSLVALALVRRRKA